MNERITQTALLPGLRARRSKNHAEDLTQYDVSLAEHDRRTEIVMGTWPANCSAISSLGTLPVRSARPGGRVALGSRPIERAKRPSRPRQRRDGNQRGRIAGRREDLAAFAKRIGINLHQFDRAKGHRPGRPGGRRPASHPPPAVPLRRLGCRPGQTVLPTAGAVRNWNWDEPGRRRRRRRTTRRSVDFVPINPLAPVTRTRPIGIAAPSCENPPPD